MSVKDYVKLVNTAAKIAGLPSIPINPSGIWPNMPALPSNNTIIPFTPNRRPSRRRRRSSSRRKIPRRSSKRRRLTRLPPYLGGKGLNLPGCFARYKRVKIMRRRKSSRMFVKTSKRDLNRCRTFNTFKYNATESWQSDINECSYSDVVLWDWGDIEPLVNGYYTTRNQATGAMERHDLQNMENMLMAVRGQLHVTMKNNSGTDVHIVAYYMISADTQNKPPSTTVTEGLTARVIDNVAAVSTPGTSLSLWPEQSDQTFQKFRCFKKIKACIEPGKEIKLNMSTPFYSYNPELADLSADENFFKGNTCCLLVRQHGQLGHDAENVDEVGILQGNLDVLIEKKYVFGFVTGREAQVNEVSEDYGTITDGVAANEDGDEKKDDDV